MWNISSNIFLCLMTLSFRVPWRLMFQIKCSTTRQLYYQKDFTSYSLLVTGKRMELSMEKQMCQLK